MKNCPVNCFDFCGVTKCDAHIAVYKQLDDHPLVISSDIIESLFSRYKEIWVKKNLSSSHMKNRRDFFKKIDAQKVGEYMEGVAKVDLCGRGSTTGCRR